MHRTTGFRTKSAARTAAACTVAWLARRRGRAGRAQQPDESPIRLAQVGVRRRRSVQQEPGPSAAPGREGATMPVDCGRAGPAWLVDPSRGNRRRPPWVSRSRWLPARSRRPDSRPRRMRRAPSRRFTRRSRGWKTSERSAATPSPTSPSRARSRWTTGAGATPRSSTRSRGGAHGKRRCYPVATLRCSRASSPSAMRTAHASAAAEWRPHSHDEAGVIGSVPDPVRGVDDEVVRSCGWRPGLRAAYVANAMPGCNRVTGTGVRHGEGRSARISGRDRAAGAGTRSS